MTTGDSTESLNRPLLEWLLDKYPDTPKKRAKQWILSGRVSVNGVVIRQPNQTIPDPQNTLEMQGRRSTSVTLEKEWRIHARLGLLYIDASLAVVNKGAGLLSVPAPHSDLSALSILDDFLAGRLRAIGGMTAKHRLPPSFGHLTPQPVHRLDQFTTGVLCLAMNPTARARLIEQFQTHRAARQYVAFVDGRPKTQRGTWRHWLRFDDNNLRQCVLSERAAKEAGDDAQEAVTHYEVIEEFPIGATGRIISKMKFNLETGRTHQIRVQAAHESLPLIGDRTYHPLYHATKQARAVVPVEFTRQALHAEILSLEHPDKPGTRMTWTAELPKDLKQLEAKLRAAQR
ncbi:MAG TPA: pseudouridine synthase [Verrucomicrobiae bacterium]|nr:pseudouridine synthase [Verrucomicrobiae bacterium]